jgi:branched-chain amino acid transport system permease protein
MKGLGSKSEREMLVYFASLVLCLGTVALVYLLLRSRLGLALTAIRDSEVASSSLGVRIGRIKLVVYVIVAAITSMIVALVVIGGIGSIEGPIVGTLLYFVLREFLSGLGAVYLMILGCMAILIMLMAPKGIWGLVNQRFGLSLFPIGYTVKDG